MPLLVLILSVAFALSPIWVPDFGGFDADQFPIPQTDPSVQPAGYAFAIWGLIYVWLILGAVFGVWRRWSDPTWAAMRVPLTVSLAVGAGWLPVAGLRPAWRSEEPRVGVGRLCLCATEVSGRVRTLTRERCDRPG